jgi:flagellar motor switch protein FliN/FliY
MNIPASFTNVPVSMQVHLGSCNVLLPELLSLGMGSKLKLDQKAGEAVTILVNNVPLARGDLYVIENESGRLGVKITEILSGKPAANAV